MGRVEFLEMCRSVAVLPKGINNTKDTPPELRVKVKNIILCEYITFYPVGYKLTFNQEGKPQHTAILHDLKANSIFECDLLKVERV